MFTGQCCPGNASIALAHARASSYATAISMEIAYGHRVLSDDDEYLEAAETFLRMLHKGGQPSLLNVSPICMSLSYAIQWCSYSHVAL